MDEKRKELKHAPQVKDKVCDMKKTQETDIVLLTPTNSRNEAHVLHTTEFTEVFYQINPTDTATHTVYMLRRTPPEIIWILRSNIS